MLASLTGRTADHSDRNCFRFSFFCDRCGNRWLSAPYPVSNGCSEIDRDEVREILWVQEHRLAFERANLEAQFHFNYCPDCGRWVCDECFRPLGSAERDLCRDCWAESKLKQNNMK